MEWKEAEYIVGIYICVLIIHLPQLNQLSWLMGQLYPITLGHRAIYG